MKKALFAVVLAALLCLCACTTALQTEGETQTEETIGQVMLDGSLYGITAETTGIAFEDEAMLEKLERIPADQAPEENGQCNLDAQELFLFEDEQCTIVIADGKQYFVDK